MARLWCLNLTHTATHAAMPRPKRAHANATRGHTHTHTHTPHTHTQSQQVPWRSSPRSTSPRVSPSWPSAATARRRTRRTGPTRWRRMRRRMVRDCGCACVRLVVSWVFGCVWQRLGCRQSCACAVSALPARAQPCTRKHARSAGGNHTPHATRHTPHATRTTGYSFPYLFDESQAAAKAYRAACTPEFYVFDADLRLTYHGRFDDARPNSNKLPTGACAGSALTLPVWLCVSWAALQRHAATPPRRRSARTLACHACCVLQAGADLRAALDATLAGKPLPEGFKARPSIGEGDALLCTGCRVASSAAARLPACRHDGRHHPDTRTDTHTHTHTRRLQHQVGARAGAGLLWHSNCPKVIGLSRHLKQA
jgi:hypothetical protein